MTLFLSGLLRSPASTALLMGNAGKLAVEGAAFVQIRNYAARKGYREKREKARVKKEVVKKEYVPSSVIKKELALKSRRSKIVDESKKRDPTDNVYFHIYYKTKVYPFAEAIQNFREANHPEIYNHPNAKVEAMVELNMQGEKKTRFVDNFTRVVAIPHKFDHGEDRTILAFSKLTETYDDIRNAGAQLVGGVDLIKSIQSGALSLQDFQYILAHPNILPELAVLRGLMKKKFPNPVYGTLSADLVKTTERYVNGICYTAMKDEYEKIFGTVNAAFGTLNMDVKCLEENFAALVLDINQMKPRRSGGFIRRCLILSKPSKEKFKVDHTVYTGEEESNVKATKDSEAVVEDDEEEEREAVAAK